MSKIQLQDFVKYGRLFEIYGSLLSADRQEVMAEYFEFNMTLVEIAEHRKVSRQAVLDAIDKACQKLDEFETALHIESKKKEFERELKDLQNLTQDKQIKEKVEQILRKI